MGGDEIKYVKDAFSTNWIAPVGPLISEFEEKLSAISSNSYVLALNSGTAAIHLALILLGVKRNDVVICPSFTFSATVNPIKYLGASPVFIDSEIQTWNMCPELLEYAIKENINKNQKPKAIILAHIYGMPAKLDEIIDISNKYDIPVIEDNAEGLGSTYKMQPLGTLGSLGIYSFNGNKIITTSGGGALVSRNKYFIDKGRKLSTQAREEKPYYEHLEIGYNYRLSNICAGIGLGQLRVLEQRIHKKREINQFYKKELDIFQFMNECEKSFSNFWLSTMLIDSSTTIDCESLRLHLLSDNIETRPLWKPMHLQPVFKDCKAYINGVSEDLFNRGLCLPSDTNMNQEDMNRVVEKIKEIYEI